MKKSTRAIHAGSKDYSPFGGVSVPIYQSSTFIFPNAETGAARFAGEDDGYIYTRMGNPTNRALEDALAALENGARGIVTATGMAAISTVFMTYLKSGMHVVSTDSVYGPTCVLLQKKLAEFGVESTFVDTSDAANIRAAIRPNTKMIYIETPANPTMSITDLEAVSQIAKEIDALFVVDNTFASPYLQRPLEFGADVVVHSLTKFLNGHSDVVGGAIVTKDEAHFKKIRPVLNLFGGSMDPHQAWLVLRGLRTLTMRVEKSQDNAAKLANYLMDHPKVEWVKYPGLESHPQHAIAKKQMDGFGAMICFGVKGGLEGGRTVMNNLKLITLAVSLGGVESLIEHPASMTHTSLPQKEREAAGIKDELVRFSVGCEDWEDLRDDLDQALIKIDA